MSVAASEIDDPALEPFGDAYGMGLDAEALSASDQAQDAAQEDDEDNGEDAPTFPAGAAVRRGAQTDAVPVAVAPAPELDGVNHVLHDVRTDTATRALIRALADDPAGALTALVARLLAVLVLRRNRSKGGGAGDRGRDLRPRRGLAH